LVPKGYMANDKDISSPAQRLRVLFVSPYPHGDRVTGGVEAVAQALIPTLALQPDIEAVQVISFDRDTREYERVVLNEKLTVHYVPAQGRLELPTGAMLNVWRARKLARQFHPHIVHGQGIGLCGDIATRLGFPAVVTAHGMVHIEARLGEKRPIIGPARIWLVDRMVRRTLGRAKMVISTSDYDRQTLHKLVRERCQSIPNPVSPEFFNYQARSEPNRVLYAGLLVPRKNVLGIVRAFAQVKARVSDARLDLVGPPSDVHYTAKVKQLIGELALEHNIVLHGHVENTQLLDLMARCSVLTLFSNEETSPTVIAQAMAMGKPIVASRVGGIPEMVKDGYNGFLVERGDEQALAEQLVALLKSPKLCQTMGARGREIALQWFKPSVVAQQTIEVYKLVLQGKI
jgi:glycosyltransferase involved in cell wall biosynthesis